MGDRIDLFAFDSMEYATADKTAVDLLGDKSRVTRDDVHNMLMVAGFTPGLGNIADVVDAILYAAEGEFGAAGLSAAAVIPFIGQAVSAKRALKIAKESGEEMLTVYRGVEKWYPGQMVKEGSFVSPGTFSERMTKGGVKNVLYATSDPKRAYAYGDVVLEFELPRSWVEQSGRMKGPLKRQVYEYGSEGPPIVKFDMEKWGSKNIMFEEGIPKAFLRKVHEGSELMSETEKVEGMIGVTDDLLKSWSELELKTMKDKRSIAKQILARRLENR